MENHQNNETLDLPKFEDANFNSILEFKNKYLKQFNDFCSKMPSDYYILDKDCSIVNLSTVCDNKRVDISQLPKTYTSSIVTPVGVNSYLSETFLGATHSYSMIESDLIKCVGDIVIGKLKIDPKHIKDTIQLSSLNYLLKYGKIDNKGIMNENVCFYNSNLIGVIIDIQGLKEASECDNYSPAPSVDHLYEGKSSLLLLHIDNTDTFFGKITEHNNFNILKQSLSLINYHEEEYRKLDPKEVSKYIYNELCREKEVMSQGKHKDTYLGIDLLNDALKDTAALVEALGDNINNTINEYKQRFTIDYNIGTDDFEKYNIFAINGAVNCLLEKLNKKLNKKAEKLSKKMQ